MPGLADSVGGRCGRCDTRSHVVSEFRRLEVRHDAEDVTSGSCSRPVPALTCVAGNGRGRSSGEARGRPFRPGATGEGKAGRVNDPESLLMPRQSDIPGRCAVPGWQGPAAVRRQTATADVPMVAGNTVAPEVKRTPGPAVSHACRTWKPRQGPAVPPGRRRSADRKGSPVPWREQDAQEANAGGRKAAGKRQRVTGPPAGAVRITGRIPGPVPGCESRLTCGG
jgi:hypothetical protein